MKLGSYPYSKELMQNQEELYIIKHTELYLLKGLIQVQLGLL
jgi:hypothetical protein